MSVKDPLERITTSNSRQRLQNRTDHLSQMEQTKLFRYAGSKSNDFFEVGQVWQTKFSLNKSKWAFFMRYLQLSTYVWVCWIVQQKFLVAVNWRQPFFTTLIHNCDADQPPKVGKFYWNNKTLLCQANPILIIVTTLVSCNPRVRLYQYMGALPRTARQSGALSEKYIGPCPSLSPSIYIVSQWQCKYHNISGYLTTGCWWRIRKLKCPNISQLCLILWGQTNTWAQKGWHR